MNKDKKEKCPECGEETLERLWMGYDPQRCSGCGYQPEKTKLVC